MKCPYCESEVEVAHDIEIYGRPVGDWQFHLRCSNSKCGASTPTVAGTRRPSGPLLFQSPRRARRAAHKIFDKLWETNLERTIAYQWLSNRMGIPRDKCHISNFTILQCWEVVRLILEHDPRDGIKRSARNVRGRRNYFPKIIRGMD